MYDFKSYEFVNGERGESLYPEIYNYEDSENFAGDLGLLIESFEDVLSEKDFFMISELFDYRGYFPWVVEFSRGTQEFIAVGNDELVKQNGFFVFMYK